MRRLPLLAAALVVPVLPVLAAGPAHAAVNVICVDLPAGAPCAANVTEIQDAITAANNDGQASEILVAPGTYTDGPYTLTGTSTTLRGSGEGLTILELPAGPAQAYLTLNGARVEDLTVELNPTTSVDDIAVLASLGAIIDRVTVDGAGTTAAQGVVMSGSTLTRSSVLLPVTSGRAVFGQGGNTITDVELTGATGYFLSGSDPDTVSRATVRAGATGMSVGSGTLDVSHTLIDLGANVATGLRATVLSGATTATVDADHLTVVGGTGSSRGIHAHAGSPAAVQTATVDVTNSVIWGPATSLRVEAGNDGAQVGPSTATLTVSHSDFQSAEVAVDPVDGAGGLTEGPGNLNADPAFVSPGTGDYRLSEGSPVVDQGDPAAGPAEVDRDGSPRVVDGDAVPGAVRDMGAFERADTVAPETTVTSGPSGPVADPTPTFAFASPAGASFECSVDGAAYAACASPFTTPALADGAHTFAVRATDAAGNTDATPASRAFTVDTTGPETTITKKPAKRVTTQRVKIKFASEAGARFECKVDAKRWRACTSPLKVRLTLGKHVVLVRATDALGNVETKPAKVKVTRVPKPA